jgi:hypothetical protein
MACVVSNLAIMDHLTLSFGLPSYAEVEFLAFKPTVVSFSVMQYLLDEYVPVQSASLMAAFHLALAVDVVYLFIQKTIITESLSVRLRNNIGSQISSTVLIGSLYHLFSP